MVEAAERKPRKFGPLVAEMDRTRRIDSIYRKLRRMQDEEKILAVEPIKGKFRTLCVDVPWQFQSTQEKCQQTYASLSQKELLALPVSSWADENAHLFLWTTNHDLRSAFELMEAWGFKYQTMITWIKEPPIGLGLYFRNSTEHILFGTRGRLLTRARNIPTHFIAPKSTHSAKPDLSYEIIEKASYPAFLDVFARKERRGWTTWGAGLVKVAA